MSEPKRFSVFYSWQSDLPDTSNRAFIRQALRFAASSVEKSEGGVIVEIDEATREVSGSPNIPATILSKISVADAFVCDMTTINGGQPNRKVPNPNVVFELGYAIANVGWERSILLFNKECGAFPGDLPFDFDRHRISDFTASDPPSDRQRRNLVDLLSTALASVIKKNPEKPNSAESPEQKRRNRDIENINWALKTLHLPTLDQHVLDCPHMMMDRVLYFWEGFNGVMNNSLFHLYDQELLNLFRSYREAFHETVRHGECYHPNVDCSAYIFTNPGDLSLPPDKDAVWEAIRLAAHTMHKVMREILDEVRTNYLEVSIDETNRTAWHDYVQFKKDQARALEDDA
jgi:hypothetical protein